MSKDLPFENPFSVRTPEILSPSHVAALFIDVLSDFPKLKETGHTFLHGARGTGKSMMLRYLEPAVQKAANKATTVNDLPFFAIHIPVRSGISVPEFGRLSGSPFWTLAEHAMVINICSRVMSAMVLLLEEFGEIENEISEFYHSYFIPLYKLASGKADLAVSADASGIELCRKMVQICDDEFRLVLQYLKRLSFTQELQMYDGALCGYSDFLFPLLREIKGLKSTPDGPIYLLIDDADNFSLGMQKILNTWVSFRTTGDVSLKITTQLRYKTYRTISNLLIESPHDYAELDINTIYTNKKDDYYKRIKAIIERRLSIINVQASAEEFFPSNPKQEAALEEVKSSIRKEYELGRGRGGYRVGDDVNRYAVPEYMRQLTGSSKNSSTYSYAGFKSLVDLSSGIIRWFLEPAAIMYAEASSKEPSAMITSIPHQLQDKVVKEWSEDFILHDIKKVDDPSSSTDELTPKIAKTGKLLFNLIESLGGIFRHRIISPAYKERRLISVMVNGQLPDHLVDVFQLGLEWGYFQESTIGTKEGLGRHKLYILSRRLAPYYKIDPSGYAGYLSVTPRDIDLACNNPRQFIRDRSKSLDVSALAEEGLFSAVHPHIDTESGKGEE